MKKKWKIIILAAVLLVVIGFLLDRYWLYIYHLLTSRELNSEGGDITIINAKIWTGDPEEPWKHALTVRKGKIAAMNADNPASKVIDAKGRLVVPGLWDGHCHPQTLYVLTSPEAPTLFEAKTVARVLEMLKDYVKKHPEDKYPRMFGWMDAIFQEGKEPTRELIDKVVSDRPVYLVHHSGHKHWANTKALEEAEILEKDPDKMPGKGAKIWRDKITGLATGLLEETELASTHGILLRTVKEKIKPLKFDQKVAVQRLVLDEYTKVGVTGIWTKDGDDEITRIYEQILRDDTLPVRAILDNLYTPLSGKDDIKEYARRAKEIENSDLPKGFLRADGVKLMVDMPYHRMTFEPYGNPPTTGEMVFEMAEFRRQVTEADGLGLHINLLCIGDRAVHVGLNVLAEVAEINPPRKRRHSIEHADLLDDKDIPRFKKLEAIAVMNPIAAYPEERYIENLKKTWGEERLKLKFERWKDLVADGAVVVTGSDFPLAPMDPLVGMHILVNGKDICGKPEQGLWPHKCIAIEDALRSYTVNPAYEAFEEHRLGMLKPGYDADFVMLSRNILDKSFEKEKDKLCYVKAVLTVFNGHIVHKDFSGKKKVIKFFQKGEKDPCKNNDQF